jgi:hypothetical protein
VVAEPIVLMTWSLERNFCKILLFLSSAASRSQPLSILAHFKGFHEIGVALRVKLRDIATASELAYAFPSPTRLNRKLAACLATR